MKNLKYIVIAIVFLSACGTPAGEQEKEKINEFYLNFKEIKLPFGENENSPIKTDKRNIVAKKFIDILTDTTGGFTKSMLDNELHFEKDYYYVGKIPAIDKKFDIVIVSELPYYGSEGPDDISITYKIYTISETGKIISSVILAEELWVAQESSAYMDGHINENYEIVTTYWSKSWNVEGLEEPEEEPENFTKGIIEKYKINNDGTIEKTETIDSQKIADENANNAEIEYYNNLSENAKVLYNIMQQVQEVELPFEFDKAYGYDSKVSINEYLHKNNELASERIFQPMCCLPRKDNIYVVALHSWSEGYDMSDRFELYTISEAGKLIDKIIIFYGGVGEDIKSVFSKDYEITVIIDNYEDEDDMSTHVISEQKYKIDADCKFVRTNLSDIEKIAKILTEKEMTFVLNAKQKYDSIQYSSDIAFIINNQASELASIFNSAIYKAEPTGEDPERWSFISDFLPGIVVGFGAESSGIEVYYNYYYLYEKAIKSPENDDNLFFEAYSHNIEISEDAISNQKHLIKFMAIECSDFETCYSLIGNGLFLKIFKKL